MGKRKRVENRKIALKRCLFLPDYAKAIEYIPFVLIPVIVGIVILMEETQGRLSEAKFETACIFFLSTIVAIGLIFGGERHYEDIKEAVHDFFESRQF